MHFLFQKKLGRCSCGCKQHKQSRDRNTQRGETAPYLETPLTFSFCMYTVTLPYNECLFISFCVYLRECARACDMSDILYACQLVAQGRLLARLTRDDQPIQQKSGCLDTNLAPINGSTAAAWTNTHMHTNSHTRTTQTHRELLETPLIQVWVVAFCSCACSPTGSPTVLCFLFCMSKAFFLLQTLLRSSMIYSKGL